MRDFDARDVTPTQDPDAFLPDATTDAEIDAMFVAEMERRDRLAACPAGYRDTRCEACSTALYVPVGRGGDVLCPQCQREGAALAAEDAADDDGGGPRPPASGAKHPDYPEFAATDARMLDDELCVAIGIADAEPMRLHLDTLQQSAFVAAMSAEVVRRLDRRAA